MAEDNSFFRRNELSRNSLLLIDNILEQCVMELESFAVVYRKRGLYDYAQKLILASENIRRCSQDSCKDNGDKVS